MNQEHVSRLAVLSQNTSLTRKFKLQKFYGQLRKLMGISVSVLVMALVTYLPVCSRTMKSLKNSKCREQNFATKFLISLHTISRTFCDEKLWHPPALLSYTMNLLTGLPRVTKDEQIDLMVKFWERPLVVTKYWESKFRSYATAADLQKNLQ